MTFPNLGGNLEKLRERIQEIKKRRPGYGELLDFYLKVREAQEESKSSLTVDRIQLNKEWKDLLSREGFSLIQREDLPLDREASGVLFRTLCRIGKEANPRMAEQVEMIEKILDGGQVDVKDWIGKGMRQQEVERIAVERGLDQKILSFLIEESVRPSVEVAVEQLRAELDPENWLKTYCPICGSLPSLSLFKGEAGKRYLFCPLCGYRWRIDRLICPFCGNREQGSLLYLYAEGEESYRIDLCERCHQYIKTLDWRQGEGSDPCMDDLATLHLDILASQKGYKRPVPNAWTD